MGTWQPVTLPSIPFQVQDIEFTQIEMKVIEGLKIGNECLNKMHQVMSIEEVERIIGETQDAVEYQRQIDELLAGSLTEEDEDAILEELNAITQEQMELPEVPSEPLPQEVPEASPVKNRPKPELVAAS
ncbi:charged multivesicular body protein 6 [Nothoprocta perdicaria]|nr:charged multivesicular body protein 6 [Nothoprocta perdicaria]